MALNTKTFLTRTASAAVFVVLLIGSVWFSQTSFILFFTIVGFIALFELYRMQKGIDKRPYAALGYALHFFSISASYIYSDHFDTVCHHTLFLFVIMAGSIYLLVKLFKKNSDVYKIPGFVLGFLYITVPCLLLIRMTSPAQELIHTSAIYFLPQTVLGMIFFIWTNDTGAYLVGSFLGKHKMYERISPGKTWEGTIGGVIFCIALSFLMVRIFPELELKHWMAISAIVAVFGTLGDLVESMLKRTAGVKDSGNIMPGHGGTLDRFDSILFSTPFVFAYLVAVGKL